jgi:hypothetical protein
MAARTQLDFTLPCLGGPQNLPDGKRNKSMTAEFCNGNFTYIDIWTPKCGESESLLSCAMRHLNTTDIDGLAAVNPSLFGVQKYMQGLSINTNLCYQLSSANATAKVAVTDFCGGYCTCASYPKFDPISLTRRSRISLISSYPPVLTAERPSNNDKGDVENTIQVLAELIKREHLQKKARCVRSAVRLARMDTETLDGLWAIADALP